MLPDSRRPITTNSFNNLRNHPVTQGRRLSDRVTRHDAILIAAAIYKVFPEVKLKALFWGHNKKFSSKDCKTIISRSSEMHAVVAPVPHLSLAVIKSWFNQANLTLGQAIDCCRLLGVLNFGAILIPESKAYWIIYYIHLLQTLPGQELDAIVKKMLEMKAINHIDTLLPELNRLPGFRYTLVLLAVYWNRLDLLKVLKANGAELNAPASDGVTALATAIYQRKHPICQWLLANGADPSVYDEDGRTALHYAAKMGDLETLTSIIALGVDVNIGAFARTFRSGKISQAHTPKYKSSKPTPKLQSLFPPLWSAVANQQRQAVSYLLEQPNINLNFLDPRFSPLQIIQAMIATGNDMSLEFLDWLFEQYQNKDVDFNATIASDRNIFTIYFSELLFAPAVNNNMYALIRLLIKYGFDYRRHSFLQAFPLGEAIALSDNKHLQEVFSIKPKHGLGIGSLSAFFPAPASDLITADDIFEDLSQCVFDDSDNGYYRTSPRVFASISSDHTASHRQQIKNELIADILNIVTTTSVVIKSETKAMHIPTRFKHFNREYLIKKSIPELDTLFHKIREWQCKILLRIRRQNLTRLNAKPDVMAEPETVTKASPTDIGPIIYEGCIEFDNNYMVPVRKTDGLLYLYLPNNQLMTYLHQLYDTQISDEDIVLFVNQLKSPVAVSNNGGFGIKALQIPPKCKTASGDERVVSHELTINSANRIGLYALTKAEGSRGPIVLTLGPYYQNGFHDNRYVNSCLTAPKLILPIIEEGPSCKTILKV